MEIQKDLHSLRSLYRILQITANDMDEEPRFLLKNLLDSARDNLLLSASQIIATGRSMSSSYDVHMRSSPKLEKQSFTKALCPQAVSEENRKRRCRVCQQRNIEKQIKDETASDFSKQVFSSIKVIESTILYLQLSSDIVTPTRLQLSEGVAADAIKGNWAENSQKINQSPAYHYVHGLRIASIPDDYGTRIAKRSQTSLRNDYLTQPEGNMGELAEKPSQMTLKNDFLTKPDRNIGKFAKCSYDKACSRMKNRMKPMLLDQKRSALSSSASSNSWRSRSETETRTETETSSHMTAESSAEESRSNSSNYSTQSYKTTCSRRKMCSMNPDKANGRLRRFKNKLGLIFHHHHHHHHHHHEEIDNKNAQRSMWKQLGGVFHHKDKQRTYEKQAVGKLKTSAVSKKQGGQLQALVRGMMKHVKHSKKTKFPPGGIRPRHDNKHWWKMLKHHPRSARKLPSRGRVRLQFKTKKKQLRALRK